MIICSYLGWRGFSHDITKFGRTLLNFEWLCMFIKYLFAQVTAAVINFPNMGYHMMGICGILTALLVGCTDNGCMFILDFSTRSTNWNFAIKTHYKFETQSEQITYNNSFLEGWIFILETDITTEKSHFQYGREDGQYNKFTEAVSKYIFSKIQSHFMKVGLVTVV